APKGQIQPTPAERLGCPYRANLIFASGPRALPSANIGIAFQACSSQNASLEILNAPLYPCICTTSPASSKTRMIARCDLEWERYFAYAIALRIASGPAYQMGPYRNSLLIRSKPSLSLRGRTS